MQIGVDDLIKRVKKELLDAECEREAEPLLYLDGVQLEVAFQVEVQAGGGLKLFVVDAKTDAKASATHKVTINLKPLTVQQRDAIRSRRHPDGPGPHSRLHNGEAVILTDEPNGPYYNYYKAALMATVPVFLTEARVEDGPADEEGLVDGQ